jgi:hypothetical protein
MRKGAVDISIGFIVVIIFAVILLSLAIVWLRGTIEQITGLTTDLSQQAQSKLTETFRQATSNFAVWPNQYEIEPGKKLVMSGGVKNNAPDGQSHDFVINVVPIAASSSVCPTGNIETCTVPGGITMKSFMEGWVTADKGPTRVEINGMWFPKITITLPNNAMKGDYIFNAMACKDILNPNDCTRTTLNWGGSSQSIMVTAK